MTSGDFGVLGTAIGILRAVIDDDDAVITFFIAFQTHAALLAAPSGRCMIRIVLIGLTAPLHDLLVEIEKAASRVGKRVSAAKPSDLLHAPSVAEPKNESVGISDLPRQFRIAVGQPRNIGIHNEEEGSGNDSLLCDQVKPNSASSAACTFGERPNAANTAIAPIARLQTEFALPESRFMALRVLSTGRGNNRAGRIVVRKCRRQWRSLLQLEKAAALPDYHA